MDPLGVLTQGEREYGLGVGTPVAMMATNTGALARYGFRCPAGKRLLHGSFM
jgi:flagellar motor component MotA